jgi:hypothetical protein
LTEKHVDDIISLAPDKNGEGANQAPTSELEQLKSGKETEEDKPVKALIILSLHYSVNLYRGICI